METALGLEEDLAIVWEETTEQSKPSDSPSLNKENSCDMHPRFIGGYIQKSFDGSGNFYGIVTGYDSPYYKIVYEDGDEEELSDGEIEGCICEKDTVPVSILSKLSQEHSNSCAIGKTTPTKKLEPCDDKKQFVCKEFEGFGSYFGVVRGYDEPYHKVMYEDGDEEDFSDDELNRNKVSAKAVPSATMKKLLKRLVAAPSATGSVGKGRGRRKVKETITSATKKRRSLSTDTASARDKKRSRGSKVEGPLKKRGSPVVTKRTLTSTNSASSPVGDNRTQHNVQPTEIDMATQRFLCRDYAECGMFFGVVYSSPNEKTSQVIFEDGAEEEMNSEELDRCACAPDAVPPTSLKFLRTLLVARAEAANGGREGSGDEAVVSMESTIALTPTSLPNSRGGGSSKKKMRKLSSSADDKKKRERKPAAIIKSPVGGAHGSGKKKSQRGKKGALCGLYITKYFEGFGNFCGLISSFDPPFYKVIYEDGDEEEVSPEDLADMLVDKTAVSDDTRAKLDAWEYTYTYAPVPAEDIPVVARTVPAKYIDLTPRELVQVEIYRRYIGRIFLDKDTGVHFKVKTVCRNETFSELLFRYVRVDETGVELNEEDPQDSEKYHEYSACSEVMPGSSSWAEWLPFSEVDDDEVNGMEQVDEAAEGVGTSCRQESNSLNGERHEEIISAGIQGMLPGGDSRSGCPELEKESASRGAAEVVALQIVEGMVMAVHQKRTSDCGNDTAHVQDHKSDEQRGEGKQGWGGEGVGALVYPACDDADFVSKVIEDIVRNADDDGRTIEEIGG